MSTYFYAEECQKSFNHGLHKYELIAVPVTTNGKVDMVEKTICVYCGLEPKPCDHELDVITARTPGGIPDVDDIEISYCMHCMGEMEKPVSLDVAVSEPAPF